MTQENSDTLEPSAIVHVPAENGAGSSKPRPNLLERLRYIAKHLGPDALEAVFAKLPVVGVVGLALRHGREQEGGRSNLYEGIGQGFGRLGRKSANIVQDSAEVVLRGVGAPAAASYLEQQRLQSGDKRNTDNRVQDGVEATARFGAAALQSAGRILKWGAFGSLALASLPIVVPVAAAAATAYGTFKLGTLAFTTLKNGAMALATGATELYKNTQEKWQDDQRARTLDALNKQLENDRGTIDAANERITKTQQAIFDISRQEIAASFEKMQKSPEKQDEIWLKMSGKINTIEKMQSLLSVIDDNPPYAALYDKLDKLNPLPRLNPSAKAAPKEEQAPGQQGSETPRTIPVTGLGSVNPIPSFQNQPPKQQGSETLQTLPVTKFGPVDLRALLSLQSSGRDA